jgi:hypothetical protein
MLTAPKKYDKTFYHEEIEGQKRRLQRLKERQEARRKVLQAATHAEEQKIDVEGEREK